ncbi:MAG: hypothetical protein EXR75_03055 [Myxococcales bacterium]|nr:hypothetical protein [Myxococcales bacterium]
MCGAGIAEASAGGALGDVLMGTRFSASPDSYGGDSFDMATRTAPSACFCASTPASIAKAPGRGSVRRRRASTRAEIITFGNAARSTKRTPRSAARLTKSTRSEGGGARFGSAERRCEPAATGAPAGSSATGTGTGAGTGASTGTGAGTGTGTGTGAGTGASTGTGAGTASANSTAARCAAAGTSRNATASSGARAGGWLNLRVLGGSGSGAPERNESGMGVMRGAIAAAWRRSADFR